MKKQFLLIFLLFLPLTKAFAEEVEFEGIKYDIVKKAKQATVISNRDNGYYSGNIVIPDSFEYEGETYSVTSIGYEAFAHCSGLTSISIPNSVTTIGGGAFSYCTGLTSFAIPNSVTTIGDGFFYGCTGLASVTIPESVTSIGSYAFAGCGFLTSVSIPNSVTKIADRTFYNCRGLTSITIPNSVTSIGEFAFHNCLGLTSVTIPNSVTTIEWSAFNECASLTSIIIPNSVTSIGIEAFRGCANLTSVTIPNSVTTIAMGTFAFCTSLASVTIPNSVTSIGSCAFLHCLGLTSITIPYSVRTIYGYAFYGCDGLSSIIMEKGVRSIGDDGGPGVIYDGNTEGYAFANCPELTDVYCYAENVPNTYNYTFEGSYVEYATLHVPESSVEKYKKAAPWSSFKNIVAIGGEGGETMPCASPVISYDNGRLDISCETEGATCYYSTGAVVISSTDYTSFGEGTDLSRDIQLMIYAYATADGYEKSEVVSKQISVPFGTVIKETVTEYVEKWDTAYVNVEVHDTTFVDVPYEVLIHDTTYVNVEVHDTTYIDVPYEVLVHDTTYVDVPYEVVVFDTISVPTAQEIPAPTIVVDNGKVEILSGMEDAIIYYTLDGTTPVVSEENRYTEPFTVSGDCTISAIAVRISDAASKELIDGIWNRPSQIATLRYYRTDGVETETPTSGVNIVVTQTVDGKKNVYKKYIK